MLASIPKYISAFLFFLLFMATGYKSFAADTEDSDRLALKAIKSEITYDPQGVMKSWNESVHFCQWEGVTCGRRHKRVTVLRLSFKGLVGTLSPHIGNLSFLRAVVLTGNAFEGRIPQEVGRLSRLEQFVCVNNSFEGEIPSNLSQCSNLFNLNLGYNKLVGKIPNDFSSLLKLRLLGLHENTLTGGIPPFIANLTSLEVLTLADCGLGGTIPDAFHLLKYLDFLQLFNNDLVGTIPPSIYNLSSISYLNLGQNQLQGSLPMNIGLMLPLLQQLIVNINNLTGLLPPSISNLSELEYLALTTNNFHGKITINFGGLQNLSYLLFAENNLGSGEQDEMKFIDSLSNCSNLEKLQVSHNQLRGALPASLGNLSNSLDLLALASNFLYGSIPSSIGNLIGLSTLALPGNQLTGTIPISIGKLKNLSILYLDNNIFSGEIPDSIGNLSSLLNVDMGANRFEGEIPSSLGSCQNLIQLSIYQNNLSGSIPRELFALSSLSIALELSENNLSGPLPPEISNLTRLSSLSLSGNHLSGDLPSSLGSCVSLEYLILRRNSFQGSIPTSFRSLQALRKLDVSSNNFSGQIPTFLERFHFQYLNLSFNNFEGEIPMTGTFSNASSFSVEGNSKVCGGIPEIGLPKCRSKKDQKEPRHKSSLAIILSITISATLLGAIMVSFFLFRWCIKKKKHQPLQSSTDKSFEKVSYEQLLKSTQGFSPVNLIGTGAFASVYKGILDEDGGITIAVKIINLSYDGGAKSFVAECGALRQIRHRNLVKVITCCSSVDFHGNDFKAIVYEFMANGSLERWLHSSSRQYLSLLQRVSIAKDVACALDYLHCQCGETIVHCDIKPSNILLDDDMVAHVGDFGLAKFLLPGISNSIHSSSIGIRGTVGYAAPEYGLGSEVSTKGDVYSYGILLLEMITGKRPTDPMFQEGHNLHKYANLALTHHHVLDIMDPLLLQEDGGYAVTLAGKTESIDQGKNYKQIEECLTLIVKIGVACSMDAPEDRMDIATAIHELNLLQN